MCEVPESAKHFLRLPPRFSLQGRELQMRLGALNRRPLSLSNGLELWPTVALQRRVLNAVVSIFNKTGLPEH